MKKYRVHWIGGKTEEIHGTDIADAFTKSGYGAGAMAAVDWYELID